jgi:hypothetical protein
MRQEISAVSFEYFLVNSKVPRWNVQSQEMQRVELEGSAGQPQWTAKLPSMRRPQHFPTFGASEMASAPEADIRARKTLTRRLPMIAHSGMMTRPHLLTVAGAAQVFHLFPV